MHPLSLPLQVLFYLIASYFDLSPPGLSHMRADRWQGAYDALSKVLAVLQIAPVAIVEASDDVNETNPSPGKDEEKVFGACHCCYGSCQRNRGRDSVGKGGPAFATETLGLLLLPCAGTVISV